MGKVKEIIVRVIPSKVAISFVKKNHYSGKVVNNSVLHFGCFLNGTLHGVMSFGSPMDKSRVIGLVQDTKWNEMLELNRMAFDPFLPRNSESRCLAIAIRLLRKNAPHVKWILSFADGTASGDGGIYRATGFVLTQIKPNKSIYVMPDGERIAQLSISRGGGHVTKLTRKLGGKIGTKSTTKELVGAKLAEGFQLRYIYLIDKSCKITVPILPFSKIGEMGAGMYRGKKIDRAINAAVSHKGESSITNGNGAFDSTLPLQEVEK